MAYQLSRTRKIIESLELTDDNGNVIKAIYINLDVGIVAKEYRNLCDNQKIVESTEKAQDKIVNETETATEKIHNSVENVSNNVQKSTEEVKNKAVSVAAAVGKAFAAMVTAATAAGTAAVMSGASAESSFAKVKTMLQQF